MNRVLKLQCLDENGAVRDAWDIVDHRSNAGSRHGTEAMPGHATAPHPPPMRHPSKRFV